MRSVCITLIKADESQRHGKVNDAISPVATQRIQLQNGGTVAVEEYGDPSGRPVFFFHGWPGSRTMAELTDEAARELGVRIISPDRPGIRDSSLQPGRTLRDWPEVLAQLAAELGLAKFRILGISGGAPYAYVSAAKLPEQVEAIAIVSGAPPIANLGNHDDLLRLYRILLALRDRAPSFLRAGFRVVRPLAAWRIPLRLRPLLLKLLQANDAEAMRDSRAFESCYESARQAWRASAEGLLIDAEIYANSWGFDLDEVQVPVSLWHGRNDRAFSFRLAEKMAPRLPSCRLHLVDGEGHFSLPIRHTREILDDLLRA